ncbi:hypothetical protein I3843_02G042200 [Carya illinoinensis]|nr:hypothetical protein I3843_02G042200 [Carya illinoinensis]
MDQLTCSRPLGNAHTAEHSLDAATPLTRCSTHTCMIIRTATLHGTTHTKQLNKPHSGMHNHSDSRKAPHGMHDHCMGPLTRSNQQTTHMTFIRSTVHRNQFFFFIYFFFRVPCYFTFWWDFLGWHSRKEAQEKTSCFIFEGGTLKKEFGQ